MNTINWSRTISLFKEILSKYNFKEEFIHFEKGKNTNIAEQINPYCTLGDIFSALLKKKGVYKLIGTSNTRVMDVSTYLMSLILGIPPQFIYYLWGESFIKAFNLLENCGCDISREYYYRNGLI